MRAASSFGTLTHAELALLRGFRVFPIAWPDIASDACATAHRCAGPSGGRDSPSSLLEISTRVSRREFMGFSLSVSCETHFGRIRLSRRCIGQPWKCANFHNSWAPSVEISLNSASARLTQCALKSASHALRGRYRMDCSPWPMAPFARSGGFIELSLLIDRWSVHLSVCLPLPKRQTKALTITTTTTSQIHANTPIRRRQGDAPTPTTEPEQEPIDYCNKLQCISANPRSTILFQFPSTWMGNLLARTRARQISEYLINHHRSSPPQIAGYYSLSQPVITHN